VAGREPPRDGDVPFMADGRRRCRGHYRLTGRTKGKQCSRSALPGLTVCAKHGGGSPTALAKSERYRKAELLARAVKRFGARRDVDPATALLEVVQQTAGDVAWLRERITELVGTDPEGGEDVQELLWQVTRAETSSEEAVDLSTGQTVAGPTRYTHTLEPHPLWVMLEKSTDRLVKASSAALAAGIAQRQVELAEAQGAMVAQAIRGVLGAMLIELRERGLPADLEAQWGPLVGQVVPAHLRALSAAADAAESMP
jgi:hypothetical protein